MWIDNILPALSDKGRTILAPYINMGHNYWRSRCGDKEMPTMFIVDAICSNHSLAYEFLIDNYRAQISMDQVCFWCLYIKNHEDIVLSLLSTTEDYNILMLNSLDNVDLFKYAVAHGANAYNPALLEIINYDNQNTTIIDMCFESGGINMNEVMISASKKGRFDIFERCVAGGGNNFNEALKGAIYSSAIPIIRICYEHGANNFEETRKYWAQPGKSAEMLELRRQYVPRQYWYYYS